MMPMMAMIVAASHSDSVSRTARPVGGTSATHRKNSTTAPSGTTQVRTNRTDAATGWPARASANPHSFSSNQQQRKGDHESERESPLLLDEIQEVAHAAASSRTENSSTEPMPRTSARVAGPKSISSRTRS